jgi:hypothetical protein
VLSHESRRLFRWLICNVGQRKNQMADENCEFTKAIIGVVGTLAGAFTGWFLGRITRADERKRRALESISDVFVVEAAKWADVSFQIDDRFKDWRRASFYRLRGHIAYVERHYKEKWARIMPVWKQFSDVSDAAYLKEKRTDYVSALYDIATALRE